MTTEQVHDTNTSLHERMAAFETSLKMLIDTVRENGHRIDENYRALSTNTQMLLNKMDEHYRALAEAYSTNSRALAEADSANTQMLLNAKIDRLTYILLGTVAVTLGTIIAQFFT